MSGTPTAPATRGNTMFGRNGSASRGYYAGLMARVSVYTGVVDAATMRTLTLRGCGGSPTPPSGLTLLYD